MSVVRCAKCDSPEVFGCAVTDCPERQYMATSGGTERERILALADELDTQAVELWHAYKSAPLTDPRRANPHTEGLSDAYEDAAQRIRAVLLAEPTR